MTPVLRHAGGQLPLPALEPPEWLNYALDAALEMQHLIRDGIVQYSAAGLQAWLTGGASGAQNRERARKLEAIKRLLSGQKLDQAERCFREAYDAYVRSTPLARAALLICREELKDGAEIINLRSEAADAIRLTG